MTQHYTIPRRSFLKGAGAALAAAAAGGALAGCGMTTGSIEVRPGDRVNNWNGLAVQLSGLFNLGVEAPQAGYEYVGVLVGVRNLSGDTAYAIGAQNILDIDAAYPVPPVENVAPYFEELARSTTDFSMQCDGVPAKGGAYLYVYDEQTNVMADAPLLPPGRTGYIELVCLAPQGWQELSVTYTPAFVRARTLTFVMQSSELLGAAPPEGSVE